MGESAERVKRTLGSLAADGDLDGRAAALQPLREPPPMALPLGTSAGAEDLARRRAVASVTGQDWSALTPGGIEALKAFEANCENLVGAVTIPVGMIGPLRVRGLHAQGDYWVPLATHEAALVASYHRGARALSEAGGASAMLLNEGVSRSPGFVFDSLAEAGQFVAWALPQQEHFRAIAEATTRHGRLLELRVTIEGNHVYLRFDFETGDAAGQNMVTIATDAVCAEIRRRCPIPLRACYVEANQSGDKKASAQSFQHVRGRKVTAEAKLPAAILGAVLGATAAQMEDYWRMSALGSALSGTIGLQGHYANGLAALFLATGQDAACVAEAAVGMTRFEALDDGSLRAVVTLPNLIVGTVGGGTGLPAQRACLELMGLHGSGRARAFAEVCAATLLAGELSIIAALATNRFARAHQVLARRRRKRPEAG